MESSVIHPAAVAVLPASVPTRASIDLLTDPRPRRMLISMLGVWLMSAFDLLFTLIENGSSHFYELNPIAAVLLQGPPIIVTVYKFSLLAVGTLILLRLRDHSVAELGCWFLLATTTYVAIRWYCYYEFTTIETLNPVLERFVHRM